MGNYIFYILIWILSLNTNNPNKITQISSKEKQCTDCHADQLNKEFVHAPADDDCMTCHQSNGNKHPQKNTKGFDLVEQVPTLCNNCHEPFNKKNLHPPAEAGECLSCHNPHSTKNHSLIKEEKTLKVCIECHDFQTEPKAKKHRPVREGKCEGCHDPHQSDYSTFLKANIPDLCFTCHEKLKELQNAENIHPPFYEECSTCHKPHSSIENKLLIQKLPDLCYECHDGVKENIEKMPVAHKVINGKKSCAGCHSPHASAFGRFLFAEGKDLCLKCHNKTIVTETRKIGNIKSMIKETNTIHPVIEEGCVICHSPHAAEYPNLLINAFPNGTYVNADVNNFSLCFDCHDSGLLTESKTDIATNFRDGSRNLHFVHINGNKARNCTVCHNVHGSPNEHLINEKTRFGNWEMPIMVTFENDGGTCNTGCHGNAKYNRETPVNTQN